MNTSMTADPIQRLGANIEVHTSLPVKAPIRHAVFDFDGTLSLIRAVGLGTYRVPCK